MYALRQRLATIKADNFVDEHVIASRSIKTGMKNVFNVINVKTLLDLLRKTPQELLGAHNFGKRKLDALTEALAKERLSLGMHFDEAMVISATKAISNVAMTTVPIDAGLPELLRENEITFSLTQGALGVELEISSPGNFGQKVFLSVNHNNQLMISKQLSKAADTIVLKEGIRHPIFIDGKKAVDISLNDQNKVVVQKFYGYSGSVFVKRGAFLLKRTRQRIIVSNGRENSEEIIGRNAELRVGSNKIFLTVDGNYVHVSAYGNSVAKENEELTVQLVDLAMNSPVSKTTAELPGYLYSPEVFQHFKVQDFITAVFQFPPSPEQKERGYTAQVVSFDLLRNRASDLEGFLLQYLGSNQSNFRAEVSFQPEISTVSVVISSEETGVLVRKKPSPIILPASAKAPIDTAMTIKVKQELLDQGFKIEDQPNFIREILGRADAMGKRITIQASYGLEGFRDQRSIARTDF